ncbi:hypothetical protein [Mycolicibacterium porcinum]
MAAYAAHAVPDTGMTSAGKEFVATSQRPNGRNATIGISRCDCVPAEIQEATK